MPTNPPHGQGPFADLWGWRLNAACLGESVELFYTLELERGLRKQAREANAKAICATCPVIAECLERAVTVGETEGIWGGLTPKERRALRNSRFTAVA